MEISSAESRHLPVVPAYIHVERCWPEVDKLSRCEFQALGEVG